MLAGLDPGSALLLCFGMTLTKSALWLPFTRNMGLVFPAKPRSQPLKDGRCFQWLSEGQTEASLSQRAEDGKTELSLMRFSLVHPQWCPPGHSSKFLGHLRGRVQQDAAAWGASSVRSPPTPGVLSNSSSPLVS